MTSNVTKPNQQSAPVIVRTDRGLTVAGSRITLYDIMDYYGKHLADYGGDPLGYVRYALPSLSEVELLAAAQYIESHRAAVEAEYQQVLQQANANQQYWETRYTEEKSKTSASPLLPEQEILRKQVEEHRVRLAK